MAWTKRQLVTEAFGELALAGYAFDVTPEEVQSALRRLEAMWGAWAGKGISVGYRFAASPDTVDPDEDSGLPMYAVETTFLNLAGRIASSYGKQPPLGLQSRASDGFDNLVTAAAFPSAQTQLPQGIPLGAGNKTGGSMLNPRFTTAPDPGPFELADDGGLSLRS